jgi:hypothetical protein
VQYLVVPNDALNDSKKRQNSSHSVPLMDRQYSKDLLEMPPINVGIVHSSDCFRGILVLHVRHICTHTRSLYVCPYVCVWGEGKREWLHVEIQFLFTCVPL